MPAPSGSVVDLESRLTDRLLDFERLDVAWPKGLFDREIRGQKAAGTFLCTLAPTAATGAYALPPAR